MVTISWTKFEDNANRLIERKDHLEEHELPERSSQVTIYPLKVQARLNVGNLFTLNF